MVFVYILLGLLLLVATTWPFIVLTHELGHAIPAMLLTKESVTVYIGSYGDSRKSLRLRLGRLVLWFRVGTFWRTGLCVAQTQHLSQSGQLLFILGGPLASSILAGFACYVAFAFELHGALKLYIVVFSLVALFDLVVNLVPRSAAVPIPGGGRIYNDGQNLKVLWYLQRRFTAEYAQAMAYYNQHQYRPARRLFERFLAHRVRQEEVFRCAISARYCLKEYTQALVLHEAFAAECVLSSHDYAMAGLLKSWAGQQQESLDDYAKALALEPGHLPALHNHGYTLTLLGQYAEALDVLNQALAYDPRHAASYATRGWAKIKRGQGSEGLADIHHALALAPDNAYAYRNLGIYYLEQGNKEEARRFFQQANALEAETHLLPELMVLAQ